jgi:sulfonate transport system permease protein
VTVSPQRLAGRVATGAAAPGRRGLPRVPVLPVVGCLSLLGLWELIGRTGTLGGSIPVIGDVVDEFTGRADILERAAGATALRALDGGLVGLAVGVVLAMLTAWFPRSDGPVLRTAVLVNAIPVVALGPVLMSMSVRPRIPEIFAALSVVFATTVTVSAGFRSSSPASDDVFRAYGASRSQRFLRLQIPAALPYLSDALRLAVPAAILGSVLGEWFGADLGLGVVMVSAMRNVQYSLLWAAALLAVAVSVVGYAAGTLLERAAAARFGRPTQTPDAVGAHGRLVNGAIAVAVPVGLVALWQLWISGAAVPAIVAPSPGGVLEALRADPAEYLRAAGLTLASSLGGLVTGAVLGVGLAVTVSLAPWLRSFLSPVALLIPTVPIVVFIPILGSVFGYGMQTVLASCVLMAFFPVYVIMLSGLGARPPGSDDLFSVYGAGRTQRLLRLSLPASLPAFLLAIRLAAANCVLIAISAEWLMGRGGLGRVFSEKRVVLDTGGAWAAVLVSVVLSVLAYRAAVTLERRLGARWK